VLPGPGLAHHHPVLLCICASVRRRRCRIRGHRWEQLCLGPELLLRFVAIFIGLHWTV
jgi:hypothetical protein